MNLPLHSQYSSIIEKKQGNYSCDGRKIGKRETDSTIFLGTHDKVIVNPDNDTKNQSKWQHNVQEGTLGEKISQYVEIHRKNRFDVRVQVLAHLKIFIWWNSRTWVNVLQLVKSRVRNKLAKSEFFFVRCKSITWLHWAKLPRKQWAWPTHYLSWAQTLWRRHVHLIF